MSNVDFGLYEMRYFVIEDSEWKKNNVQIVKNKPIHISFNTIKRRLFLLATSKISSNVLIRYV